MRAGLLHGSAGVCTGLVCEMPSCCNVFFHASGIPPPCWPDPDWLCFCPPLLHAQPRLIQYTSNKTMKGPQPGEEATSSCAAWGAGTTGRWHCSRPHQRQR